MSNDEITVYAHVERTVHALCSEIERQLREADDENAVRSEDIKQLAEAVQALSASSLAFQRETTR